MSLPSIKHTEDYRHSQLQMIYSSNTRLPPRLPKLESEEIKQMLRKKYTSVEKTFDPSEHTRTRPKSIIKCFATKTKAGCQPNKNPKINQDSVIINSLKTITALGYSFWGVCDGHGVNGHIVSGMIKTQLPSKISF